MPCNRLLFFLTFFFDYFCKFYSEVLRIIGKYLELPYQEYSDEFQEHLIHISGRVPKMNTPNNDRSFKQYIIILRCRVSFF